MHSASSYSDELDSDHLFCSSVRSESGHRTWQLPQRWCLRWTNYRVFKGHLDLEGVPILLKSPLRTFEAELEQK